MSSYDNPTALRKTRVTLNLRRVCRVRILTEGRRDATGAWHFPRGGDVDVFGIRGLQDYGCYVSVAAKGCRAEKKKKIRPHAFCMRGTVLSIPLL